MASHYSANQYDDAFRARRLQQYTVPKQYKEHPATRTGNTKIVATETGHLLPGVPRSEESPWGNFRGTWELPNRIPGNHLTNACARKCEPPCHETLCRRSVCAADTGRQSLPAGDAAAAAVADSGRCPPCAEVCQKVCPETCKRVCAEACKKECAGGPCEKSCAEACKKACFEECKKRCPEARKDSAACKKTCEEACNKACAEECRKACGPESSKRQAGSPGACEGACKQRCQAGSARGCAAGCACGGACGGACASGKCAPAECGSHRCPCD